MPSLHYQLPLHYRCSPTLCISSNTTSSRLNTSSQIRLRVSPLGINVFPPTDIFAETLYTAATSLDSWSSSMEDHRPRRDSFSSFDLYPTGQPFAAQTEEAAQWATEDYAQQGPYASFDASSLGYDAQAYYMHAGPAQQSSQGYQNWAQPSQANLNPELAFFPEYNQGAPHQPQTLGQPSTSSSYLFPEQTASMHSSLDSMGALSNTLQSSSLEQGRTIYDRQQRRYPPPGATGSRVSSSSSGSTTGHATSSTLPSATYLDLPPLPPLSADSYHALPESTSLRRAHSDSSRSEPQPRLSARQPPSQANISGLQRRSRDVLSTSQRSHVPGTRDADLRSVSRRSGLAPAAAADAVHPRREHAPPPRRRETDRPVGSIGRGTLSPTTSLYHSAPSSTRSSQDAQSSSASRRHGTSTAQNVNGLYSGRNNWPGDWGAGT